MKHHVHLYYRLIILFISICFFSLQGVSQCSISGKLTDSLNVPVPYAPVALIGSKDSSIQKGAVTDQNGNYCFERILKNEYKVKIVAIGFNELYSDKVTYDSLHPVVMPTLILHTNSTTLKEVGVVAFKPTIELNKGKIILNVENSLIAKGNTVLDLLKQIPGVNVDAQNNITVNGVAGVQFLMDDRIQPMTDAQMADILSGMSAETIISIELIKTPPAKYDATGSSALINIVTKKAKLKGFNGSINESFSQGKKARSITALTLNYKNDKFSAFSNISYNYTNLYFTTRLDRSLYTINGPQIFNSSGDLSILHQNTNFNGGIEYEITPKTSIGIYVNGNLNIPVSDQQATTIVLEGNEFNYKKLTYHSYEKESYSTPNVNLNILHKIDSLGSQFQVSSNYTHIIGYDDKFVENRFYDADANEILAPTSYQTNLKSLFQIFYQKLDYTKMLKKGLSIEAGLKGNFIAIDHGADYALKNSTMDTTLQNKYDYKENVLAAYTTLSKSFEKVNLSIGVRAEQTNIDGKSLTSSFTLNRHYINYFPSSSFDYKINSKNTLSGSYSYRIRRPDFGRMNPTRIFNDELSYTVGNPTIKPNYAHAMSINHNLRGFITTSFECLLTKDFMYWYSYTPKGSKINVDTTFNFRSRSNYNLSVFIQKQIKWFNLKSYTSLRYNDFKGTINGEPAVSATFQFYGSLNTEFILPKGFKIQVTGFYSTPFRDAIQLYTPRSSVNFMINKSFLKNKLDITLAFQDILYMENGYMSSRMSDQYYYNENNGDSRRIRISLNYKFGKMHIEQKLNNGEDDGRFRK
ncbi:MAG TPA: TonB-dependent receptor [Bacteroidia bacterium]|nr:TonB-dependent receptor [Bacteroidia bacterium]